jgi:hypothetical protein
MGVCRHMGRFVARVLRGGSWDFIASYVRASFRSGVAPGGRNIGNGFRVLARARFQCRFMMPRVHGCADRETAHAGNTFPGLPRHAPVGRPKEAGGALSVKRHGNLFGKIVSTENLVDAAYKASRGKRKRPDIVSFNRHLIDEVIRLQRELESGTYRDGAYREFFINEGKPRRISAAPFRDRVVHHALCNAIMPILGKSYIDNTFANRKWKGTHRAVKLFRRYCRRHEYYLKCDIRKFLDS